MAYKLAEEDKLCGIEYPTYEGYKPIPKATCEMLETQCGGIEIVFNCEKKKEDEKPTPKPTPQPEPTPEEPKPQPEEPKPNPKPQPEEPKPEEPKPEDPKPQPNPVDPTPDEPKPDNPVEPTPDEPVEPTPTPNPDPEVPTPDEPAPKPVLTNEELDEIVSGKLRNEGTLGKYNANQNNKLISVDEPTPEEIEAYKKEITDKVGDIPELEGYTVEVSVDKIPSEAPEVGSEVTGAPLYTKIVKITKPNGDVYQSEPMSIGTTTEKTIDLLEALPSVEDKFSTLITKDGQVVYVPEVSEEDKRAFEDKIINELKAKLPEGTTVEAVLEGPAYEKGSEVIGGKTNYNLKVRTTLNGKVSEHTYKVPHTEEPAKEFPEGVIDKTLSGMALGNITTSGDEILSITRREEGAIIGKPITDEDLPSISKEYADSLDEGLNRGIEGNNRYKVNSFNITLDKHVGDFVVIGKPIFSYTATITKPYGEVVTKEGKLDSGWIDSL